MKSKLPKTNTHDKNKKNGDVPATLFEISPFHIGLVAPTFRAEPFALGLAGESDTVEMEPFDLAGIVVAANHLPVRHLLAQTVGRFVGVNWWVNGRLVLGVMLLLARLTLLLLLRSFLFLLLGSKWSWLRWHMIWLMTSIKVLFCTIGAICSCLSRQE